MISISIKSTHNKIRGIAFPATMLLLLSVMISSQNTFVSTVYADHNDDNDNNKVKNRSLINDISDQVIDTRSNKERIQSILQLIQIQIAQTSGQDKATKTINLINSIINLNPNGPLAQSLLYLSKQQANGNINSVIEAAIQVAAHVASGGEDIEEIIKQAASHTQQVLSSESSSSTSLLQSPPPAQSLPPIAVQQQQQPPQQQSSSSQTITPSSSTSLLQSPPPAQSLPPIPVQQQQQQQQQQ